MSDSSGHHEPFVELVRFPGAPEVWAVEETDEEHANAACQTLFSGPDAMFRAAEYLHHKFG
ncbi:MAG TPA: hypothetical protein VGH15_06615 [Caulobacteraceae bacterium]|jgi:hypothetical protein